MDLDAGIYDLIDVPEVFYAESTHSLEPRMHYLDFGFHEEDWTPPPEGEVPAEKESYDLEGEGDRGLWKDSGEESDKHADPSSDSDYVPERPVRSSTRATRTAVDVSGELYDDLGPLSDRKRTLEGMSWKQFTHTYKCTLPTRFPDYEASRYHPNMFLSEEEVRLKNGQYSSYTETAFSYYTRKRGRQASSDNTKCLALNNNMSETAWKLFVGLDESEVRTCLGRDDIRHIYHGDVESLLQVLKLRSMDPEFMDRRRTFRQEFIGDAKCRPFDFNGVIWLVSQQRDLPWMIPIENFHFHNAMAVYWRKATLYEMILCGRLVNANERLYLSTDLYKRLFPFIVHMNKHLVHKRDDPDLWEQDVWDNWHGGARFFWYRPCFRVCVVPSPTVRYCMMLAFERETTRTPNGTPRDAIVVPAYSHVYSFAGEVRPVDLSVDDNYAFDLINNKGEKHVARRAGSGGRPELVCTNYILYDNRPGVGSAAYMANHTCGMGESTEPVNFKELRPNENFYMSEIRVGNKEGNAISKADMLTVFASLKSSRDITANMVTDWMDSNRRWLSIAVGESMTGAYDLFPVEFVYNRDPPGETSTECMCQTRCSGLAPSLRSRINISNVCSLTARPSRTDISVLHEEIDRFIPDKKEHAGKRGYIREYLRKQGFGDAVSRVV